MAYYGLLTESCAHVRPHTHAHIITRIHTQAQTHTTQVQVISARGLNNEDFGKQDPYVVVKGCGQKFQTKTHKKGGKNPVWNETYAFNLFGQNAENDIKFRLWDQDVGLDDAIGYVDAGLGALVKGGNQNHPVLVKKLFKDTAKGTLQLKTEFKGVYVENLTITVVKGINLRDKDFVGKQDPYVNLKLGDKKFKTRTHTDGGTNPLWNESFIFNMKAIGEEAKALEVTIKDEDVGRDDVIAELNLNIMDLLSNMGKGEKRYSVGKGFLVMAMKGSGNRLAA